MAGIRVGYVVVGPVDSIRVYCTPLREVWELRVPHLQDFGIWCVCFGVVKRMVVCKVWSLEVYGENSQNLVGSQRVLRLGMYYDFDSDDNYVISVRRLEEDMEGMIGQHEHCAHLVDVNY